MSVYQKTAKAEEDLIDIWLYISPDNPAAADNLLNTFEEKGWLLADNPWSEVVAGLWNDGGYQLNKFFSPVARIALMDTHADRF